MHGVADHAKQQPVTKQTLFEIGSVTKPLVGLLTALAVVNEQLTVDTKVADLLRQPAYQQHQYTLAQLLAHQSGLPRLPENFPLTDLTDPYAKYSNDDLMAALQQVIPGEPHYEYSNLGYGLLAELVSQQQDSGLAELLVQQIFSPLGMEHSTLAHTGGSFDSLAQGHHFDGSPSTNWQFDVMAGAGAVLSSIDDMVMLVQHYLRATSSNSETVGNKDDSSLAQAMRLTLTPATEAKTIGFGWILQPEGLVWHNGQTAGFNAFAGFAPAEQVGIIILANHTSPVTPGAMALLQQLQQQSSTFNKEQTE